MKTYQCLFCDRTFDNIRSLGQHKARCKNNPDHIDAWNKGFTKETHPSVKRCGDTLSRRIKSGEVVPWMKGQTKDINNSLKILAKNVSNTINTKVQANEWHSSFSSKRRYFYKGHELYGTWEFRFAKFLDKHNIKWDRPSIGFPYSFNDAVSYYYPDFYLLDYGVFIEIKAVPVERDYAKWYGLINANNKLIVLFGSDLARLSIINNSEYKEGAEKNIPPEYLDGANTFLSLLKVPLVQLVRVSECYAN